MNTCLQRFEHFGLYLFFVAVIVAFYNFYNAIHVYWANFQGALFVEKQCYLYITVQKGDPVSTTTINVERIKKWRPCELSSESTDNMRNATRSKKMRILQPCLPV